MVSESQINSFEYEIKKRRCSISQSLLFFVDLKGCDLSQSFRIRYVWPFEPCLVLCASKATKVLTQNYFVSVDELNRPTWHSLSGHSHSTVLHR